MWVCISEGAQASPYHVGKGITSSITASNRAFYSELLSCALWGQQNGSILNIKMFIYELIEESLTLVIN